MNGVGKFTSYQRWSYEGEVVNGNWEGQGTYTKRNGDKQTGLFVNDNLACDQDEVVFTDVKGSKTTVGYKGC